MEKKVKRGRQGKRSKGRPGDGCPCRKQEDLGKIQGRSIDLGECGVQECWVERSLGESKRKRKGVSRA